MKILIDVPPSRGKSTDILKNSGIIGFVLEPDDKQEDVLKLIADYAPLFGVPSKNSLYFKTVKEFPESVTAEELFGKTKKGD
jgi:hypothetical protein